MTTTPDISTGDYADVDHIMKLFGTDTGAATADTTSYTEIATIAVDAGKVNNFIIIHINVTAKAFGRIDDGTKERSYPKMEFQIGETGSETQKAEFTVLRVNPDSVSNSADHFGYATKTITFYYEPTSDEKTNGFNVICNGKLTEVSSPSTHGHLIHKQMIIIGI